MGWHMSSWKEAEFHIAHAEIEALVSVSVERFSRHGKHGRELGMQS